MNDDLALAVDLVEKAGTRVVDLSARGRWKGLVLAELGDNAADGFLCGYLAAARPNDALLSEETTDSRARLAADRVWIIDPIDGSKEYGVFGAEWAVQLALWRGGELAIGALGIAAHGRLFAGAANGDPKFRIAKGVDRTVTGDTAEPLRPRLVVSKNHTPPWAPAFVERIGGELVVASGVGYKVGQLVAGEADVYVHEGTIKLNEWDTAAPEAVARAFAWGVTRLDGRRIAYNQAPPLTGDFLVCRPRSRDRFIAALKDVGAI